MDQDRFKLRASVHILFKKGEQILLLLRKNITSDGLYSLVAGHLDEGETVTDAFIREAREEVGVDVKPKDLQITTVCHSYNQERDREFIQFYAICEKWQGEFENMEPDKCGDLKFFSTDQLPENIVPYIKDAIPKVLSGVNYYEYGWENI